MEQRYKIIIINVFLLFISFSCSRNDSGIKILIEKYKSGEIYVKEKTFFLKDSVECTFFYQNGQVKEVINSNIYDPNKICHANGLLKSYYPDGFPKEYCMLTDSGRNVRPTKERILEGFETQFDYCSKCAHDSVGNKYVVFRLFIKNVHPIDQIVVIKCPDDEYRYAFKMEPEINHYTIVDEKGEESEVEIDESMYSFYVPIDNDYMFSIGDGKYELKVGVFFQEFVGDEDLPSPHVSFTAIIDPDEEYL